MRSTPKARTTHRCLAAVLSALLASGSLTPALAMAQAKPKATKTAKASKADEEQKRAAARQHYADAEEKLRTGDFQGAFEGYKAANDLLPAPITIFKMAFCQDKLGKTKDALAGYEAFLAANAPGALEDRVAEAEGRMKELRAKLPGTLRVGSTPEGASVFVDDVAQEGVAPIDLELSPGRHTVRLQLEGHEPASKEVEVKPGGSEALSLTLAELQPSEIVAAPSDVAPPAAAETAEVSTSSKVVPYVLVGLAGAGAVVGGVFGVKAMQSKRDFDKGTRTSAKADEADRSALIADMAFGAALTFGITGLVLLLTDDGPSAETQTAKRSSVQFSPYVSTEGAGAGAFVQF